MEFDFSIQPLVQLAIDVTLSAILALIVGPIAIFLARRLGAIDVPGSAMHKKHTVPMPLAGGLVLFLILPVMLTLSGLWRAPMVLSLSAGTAVIFLFGLMDDTRGLSALQKFSGQLIAVAILISSGVSIKFLENFNLPLAPWTITALDWALSVLWLVGITNAFNLIDSMDGLVAGLATISAGFFSLISLASQQVMLAELAAILFGVSIGLYFYNITPARLFLGDSGAQALGFMLATIGILYNPPDMPQGSTWFMPVLLLAVPIFDTTLVVISRLRRRKPLFTGDLSHTYHRLVRLGMAPSQAVLIIQIAALLMSNAAFIVISLPPQYASLFFALVILAATGLMIFFERAVKIEP